MPLEALIVSQDAGAIRAMHRVLGELGVVVEDCPSPSNACEMLNVRKLDAVIVDCDDLRGALDVLRHVRKAPSNRTSIVFAILNGITSVHTAFELGANFVFDKPITVERVSRSLRAAHGMMVRERRRYFRQPVEMRLALTTPNGVEFHAAATNLSEGGLAVRTDRPLSPGGPYKLRFLLPGTRVNIEARAELAWNDGAGRCGLRFQHVHPASREEIERWLSERIEIEDAAPLLINPSRPLVRVRGA